MSEGTARRPRAWKALLGIGAIAVVLNPIAPAVAEWLPRISDESGGTFCTGKNARVVHVACFGSYCDDINQYCEPVPWTYSPSHKWNFAALSEEDGLNECRIGGQWAAIGGMECVGDYCDNIRLECRGLPAGHGFSSNPCYFTPWFSEETPNNFASWSNGLKAARAMECAGDYCDSMRFLICDQI